MSLFMIKFTIRRLLTTIPVLLGVLLIVFTLSHFSGSGLDEFPDSQGKLSKCRSQFLQYLYVGRHLSSGGG